MASSFAGSFLAGSLLSGSLLENSFLAFFFNGFDAPRPGFIDLDWEARVLTGEVTVKFSFLFLFLVVFLGSVSSEGEVEEGPAKIGSVGELGIHSIPHRDHKPRLSSRHNVFHSSFSVFLNLFFCFEEQDFDSDDPSESASSLPIRVSASLLPISASNAFSFSKLLVSIMIYHVTFYNIFNLILLYLLIIVFILSSFLVFVSVP